MCYFFSGFYNSKTVYPAMLMTTKPSGKSFLYGNSASIIGSLIVKLLIPPQVLLFFK